MNISLRGSLNYQVHFVQLTSKCFEEDNIEPKRETTNAASTMLNLNLLPNRGSAAVHPNSSTIHT